MVLELQVIFVDMGSLYTGPPQLHPIPLTLLVSVLFCSRSYHHALFILYLLLFRCVMVSKFLFVL